MALANFFDRTATAASQVLSHFDLAAFRARLEDNPVEIAFDHDACAGEGAKSLDLLVRLLSRLYPILGITPTGGATEADAEPYRRLARTINPDIDLKAGDPTVRMVVGRTAVPGTAVTFYLGSAGWVARLSTSAPVGSGASGNPFGAGAAACFAAANCFRTVFRDQLTQADLDHEICLSLADYGRKDLAHTATDDIDLGDAHLVGAGAIGHGFLWAMARTDGVRGTLHVVDHETADLSNLQRYVLTTQSDVDRAKTAIAEEQLREGALHIVPHTQTWQAYLDDRNDWCFGRVAVALDNAPDRMAVQASLPQWITNAWTQEHDLGVSRHEFGRSACLACLYLPRGKAKDQDELVAEELGLPEARMDVRRMLQTGEGIDAVFVMRVAEALNVPVEPLLEFVGQPLSVFRQGAICGGLVMRLSNGLHPVRAVVPMAFQSALAGIMLAAEMLKHAASYPAASTVSTRINLLRPLAAYVDDPKARDASGRCLCADEDFLDAYRTKYAA